MKKIILYWFFAYALYSCEAIKSKNQDYRPIGYFSNEYKNIWVEFKEDSTFVLVNNQLRTFSKGKWESANKKITLYCISSDNILDHLVNARFVSDTIYFAKVKGKNKILLHRNVLYRRN